MALTTIAGHLLGVCIIVCIKSINTSKWIRFDGDVQYHNKSKQAIGFWSFEWTWRWNGNI